MPQSPLEVETPDGIVEFPSDTEPSTIENVIGAHYAHYGGLSAPQTEGQSLGSLISRNTSLLNELNSPDKSETPDSSLFPTPKLGHENETPLFNLGDALIKGQGQAGSKTEEGINEALRPALNSLTTPQNLFYMAGSMGLASAGSVARTLVSALWAGFMGKNAVENAPKLATELGEEMGKPEADRDPQKIARILTEGGIDTAMALAPAVHVGTEGGKMLGTDSALDSAKPETIDAFKQQAAQELPQPEVPNASSQQQAAEVHGDVLTQPVPSEGEVPAAEGSGGIQSQAEGGLPEQSEPDTAQEKVVLSPESQAAELEQSNAPKGIAASVRNKWTRATESPLGSEAGFINLDPIKELWDKYSPSVKAVIDNIKGIASEQMNLSKTSDYRRSVLNWSAKLQRSFGEAAAAQKEIQDKVSDPVRRDGITNWIQAGGDKTVLQDRLAKTLAWRDPTTGEPHPQAKQLAAGYEAALNLTPDEKAVSTDAKQAYDTMGARGQAHDVLNSFKDNYVTQIWDLKKGPISSGSRTLKDRFKFSKASTFPTFFDGEQAGFVPKTKDISKLLPVYLHEMNSVIAARQLVEEMSKGKASDGRPLLAAKGRGVAVDDGTSKATLILPDALNKDFSDYKSLDNQPALHDWRWQTKDSGGNPVFMKADLAIHPEAFDKFKNVLGKSAIKEWYDSKGSMSAAIPKAMVKGLDLFQSETKRTMLGLLTPFHQVQEGTHAVGHRVNPFFNNPTIDLVNNKPQMDAAQHGLMLLPDRTSADQFMEGFKQSKIVSAIPGLGPLADHYSNYLFHQYIPGIKFKTYEAILERNLKVYEKDLNSGTVNPEDVKILSASQANAAYGHLNYADLARNPTMLHLMRLGMLAPDFLEARMRFSGQAIKGLGGAKIGREQFIALATLAVAQAGLSYIASKTTGGQWDPKDPFSFHVGNRKFTMRSVPEDSLRLASDSRAFVYARLNPVFGKGSVQLLSGTDWRGRKVTTGETLKEIAQQPIPLALRPLFGAGNSPLSPWEQLAGAAGLKISRYSAQTEVRKLAHDWMGKSTDPKTQAAEARYQKENPPDSDYKPLREALINNDFKTAQVEYKKLLETRKPDAVSKVFNTPRPFSGSAAREAKFKQSLSPDNLLLYNQAKQEQLDLKHKLSQMRLQMNQP